MSKTPSSFDDLPAELMQAPSAYEIWRECAELAKFLIEKNKAYGDSALKPLRVMSKADPAEQIRVRMDDKLSRLVRGQAAGEDAVRDFVGYYVLLLVCERQKAAEQREGEREGFTPAELELLYMIGQLHGEKLEDLTGFLGLAFDVRHPPTTFIDRARDRGVLGELWDMTVARLYASAPPKRNPFMRDGMGPPR